MEGAFPRKSVTVITAPQRLSLKMKVHPFIRLTVDAALCYFSGISWHDRECFRFSIEGCKQMCGVPVDATLKIGECAMLTAALSIIMRSARGRGTRNIILRADNQNAPHWIRKGKAKHGNANRILKFVIDFRPNATLKRYRNTCAAPVTFRRTASPVGRSRELWIVYT